MRSDILGLILIVIVVLILLTLVIAWFTAKRRTISLDPATLCPTMGAEGKTAILIDRTDPLTDIQQQELKVYLNDLKVSVPLHAAISIYKMDNPRPGRIEPVIFLCNPGQGENKSPWLSNPALIKKVWHDKFSKRLNAIIMRMMRNLRKLLIHRLWKQLRLLRLQNL